MMEEKVTERICLGENGKHTVMDFRSALDKANRAVKDLISELGITLGNDTAQDLITGGIVTELRLNDMIKTALDGAIFPFQKQEVEARGDKMKIMLIAAVRLCKYLISPDYGLSSKMFYVDADSRIRLCDEGVEVLKDTEKLYIDKPEQIDVYRDCKAIVEAVDRLNRKVAAYGMTSTTGGRAVLMFAPDGSICLNPYNIADCYTGNYYQRHTRTSPDNLV